MSTVEVPANSNASVVKKRVRKRKTGGGGKANAIHPDRHKKREDSELRLSRKLNKYKADGSLVVDNSETLARQAALKEKLAADVAARQAGIRAKAAAKEQELLRVGARMAGRRRGALAAWRERRRRNSIIAMSEASAAEAAIDRLDLTQRDLRKVLTSGSGVSPSSTHHDSLPTRSHPAHFSTCCATNATCTTCAASSR